MEKRFLAWLIAIYLFLGCLGQKPDVPDCTQEDQVVYDHNMNPNAAKIFTNIDADDCSGNNMKEKTVIEINDSYKYETFFPYILKDIENDTSLLESGKISPLVADYREAAKAGVDPEAFYYIKSNLEPEKKQTIYEMLNDFDKPTQIEAAKAYGVNLKFNELEFFAKDPYGAGKALQGGYSEIEDKYIEEVMKSFNEDLAKYLTRGALRDDAITDKDLNDVKWFETQKWGPSIKNLFNETLHPQIGTVDSVYFTDGVVRDNRAVSSAPEEAKYLIPPGHKIVVHTLNPGDYIENGKRWNITMRERDITKAMKKNLKPMFNLEDPKYRYTSFYIGHIPDAEWSDTWFFDDPLILGPDGTETGEIDHAIRNVEGKWSAKSHDYLFHVWHNWAPIRRKGDYNFSYGDWFEIGLEKPAGLYMDGYTYPIDKTLAKNAPEIGIYIYR